MGFDTELTVNVECGNSLQFSNDIIEVKAGLTDLDTLLSDISDITEADAARNHSQPQDSSMDTASLRMLDFQGPFQDEVTFYDDPVPLIKKEKMDMSYTVLESEQQQQPQQPEMPYDADLDKVRREIEYACITLDIPAGECLPTFL